MDSRKNELTFPKSPENADNKLLKLKTDRSNKGDSSKSRQSFIEAKNLLDSPIKISHKVMKIHHKVIPILKEIEVHYHSFFQSFPINFQEKAYTFRRRRESLIENKCYFNSHILAEKNLVDSLKSAPIQYYQTLEVQYEEFKAISKDFNKDIFSTFSFVLEISKANNYIKSLFTNPPNLYFSRISSMFDFKDYLSNFHIERSGLFSKYSLIRISMSDGDSFYRAFMFSLIENYILKADAHELRKLILDVYKIMQQNSSYIATRKEQLNCLFNIFHEILIHIENYRVCEAHKTLVSAFNSEDCFFNDIIIFYLRFLIHLVAESYYDEAFKTYPGIKSKLVSGAEDIHDINLLMITNIKNEVCKYTLQLIPTIFNVNLEILIIDGYVQNSKGQVKSSFETFRPQKTNKFEGAPETSISLVYFLNNFLISYEENGKVLKEIKKYPEIYQTDFLEFKLIQDSSVKCERCKKSEDEVSVPEFGVSFCLLCAKELTDFLCKQRASTINKENYHSREYYCRPFSIIEGFEIGDMLYTHLFKQNIATTVASYLKLLCFSCDTVKTSSDLITLSECNCQFCLACLESYIIKYTQGKYILNKLEKSGYPKIKCPCSNIFNAEMALSYLDFNQAEREEEAMQRLEKYTLSFCMRCIKRVIDSMKAGEIGKQSEVPHVVVQILELKSNPTETQLCFGPHLLCIDCLDILRQAYLLEPNGSNKVREANCKICDTTHYIQAEIWKELMKPPSCKCLVI